jgi:hypothetical protein
LDTNLANVDIDTLMPVEDLCLRHWGKWGDSDKDLPMTDYQRHQEELLSKLFMLLFL